ncbi:MAG TPA: metallophosphoesterase [Gemmatimonadaceae bacterium]
MASRIRLLLVADSHLGFDLPVRPRVGRRRRGYDFLANYSAALAPALAGEVDLVVHAGDVFDRSSVVPTTAYQAYEPLRRVADVGVPVFIVPGNHERSRLPHARFASHPRIHVFDGPRSFVANVGDTSIVLSGFPYERRDVRTKFASLLEQTEWQSAAGATRVLCIHHCVEGATVGPGDFTFTTAADVIRTRDIPLGFDAVLSGHIHRHQVLTTDLSRKPLNAPVLYPGSIERTSFAEMDETKGFMIVHIDESEGDRDVRREFRRLPARPMVREELSVNGTTARTLETAVHAIIARAPDDAVLSIRIAGELTDAHWRVLSGVRIRAIAPETMNVEISPVNAFERPPRVEARTTARDPEPQLSFI